MKKKYLFALFFLCSCASITNQGLKSRTVEDFYNPTGVEKYFLTDLPGWANFNQTAGCFRASNIRYFDIDALMKSYGLSYSKSLQMQATFNEEVEQFKSYDKNHVLSLKEEELLFYKVSDKISSKIIFFDPPVYKKINLVWLDEVLGDKEKEKKLRNFLNSKTMDEGVPLLISFCLTRSDVEKQFSHLNVKMITAELFSVYNSSGIKSPSFKIELDQFFKKDQRVYFYSQKKSVITEEIKGLYKILNY